MSKGGVKPSTFLFCFQELYELSRQTYAEEMEQQRRRPVKRVLRKYFAKEFLVGNEKLQGYKCNVLGTNGAIGTVLCHSDSTTVRHIRNREYKYEEDDLPGQANAYEGQSFPFKGGLESQLNIDGVNVRILNVHVSSKNIENRRAQVADMLKQSLMDRKDASNTIFLLAGDVNSRIGSNYALDSINALQYYNGGVVLKHFMRACMELADQGIEFDVAGLNNASCSALLDFVHKNEEWATYFAAALPLSGDTSAVVREVAPRRFGPTFCYDKSKQLSRAGFTESYSLECSKQTENTISWPDRIFVVEARPVASYRYHIEAEVYDSVLLPLSDHMPVLSLMRIVEPCVLGRSTPDIDIEI